MTGRESRYPEDWIAKACKDLDRVRLLLGADDTEGAGFHLQQAVEKALKAFLLLQGITPRPIHDLSALLDKTAQAKPDLERFRKLCEEATDFYIP